jgi:molybdopterin-biosynthesis enzyme MoeA-like protein
MEGLAQAIGRPLVMRPEHEAWMRERTAIGHQLGYFESPEPNAGLLKMCRLPEGSQAMPNDIGTALGAIVKVGPKPTMLFTLPGVPKEFYRMFNQSVRPHLAAGSPIHTEELVLYAEESRFFSLLAGLEKKFPEVVLGSYPEERHIRIRATGPRQQALAAIAELKSQALVQPYLAPQGRFR